MSNCDARQLGHLGTVVIVLSRCTTKDIPTGVRSKPTVIQSESYPMEYCSSVTLPERGRFAGVLRFSRVCYGCAYTRRARRASEGPRIRNFGIGTSLQVREVSSAIVVPSPIPRSSCLGTSGLPPIMHSSGQKNWRQFTIFWLALLLLCWPACLTKPLEGSPRLSRVFHTAKRLPFSM